jgi:protein involved in polysaccharide export with SLBB domain
MQKHFAFFCSRLATILLSTAVSILSLQATPQAHAAESGASYVLTPNDVLEIKVFQEDDLESKLRVAQNGTINFPLIGMVSVAGRTPNDAAAAIRAALAKDYLVNPQVTVTVAEYGKRRFTVIGQVQKAGSYDMPEREQVHLLDAIAMAGGYTRIADASKITVKRRKDGKEVTLKLDAKAMAKDNQVASFLVEPNDVITVWESIF